MATHVQRHLTAPSEHPLFGEAALEADLLASLDAALDEALQADIAAERPALPVVSILYGLCDARSVPTPESVLGANLAAISDDVLVELRLRLFESGASRLRLAGALGARLALRGLADG